MARFYSHSCDQGLANPEAHLADNMWSHSWDQTLRSLSCPDPRASHAAKTETTLMAKLYSHPFGQTLGSLL